MSAIEQIDHTISARQRVGKWLDGECGDSRRFGATPRLWALFVVRPMRKSLSAFLALLSAQACCADFDARLRLADTACVAPGAKAYLVSVYDHLFKVSDAIITHCFLSIPAPVNAGFVVVADIDSEGKIVQPITRPATNLAACFAHEIQSEAFPKPALLKRQKGFPVVFNMDAVPVKAPFKLKCGALL